MFAYCNNNPVNNADLSGTDGAELCKGWYYRIDPENAGTRTKRHIHIWKKGKSYAQNDDGSPHDEGGNDQGKLPKSVQKLLLEKIGWDYNGKRDSFFSKTELTATDSSIIYSYADGSVSSCTYPLGMYPSAEDMYGKGSIISNPTTSIYLAPILYLPIAPALSFNIAWSMASVALAY